MPSAKEVKKFSERLKILYVEDNVELRQTTAALFSSLFESVDIAGNGEEGLEKYNKNVYDIVITDINMPKMNGLDMIDQIYEINPEQKIIAISAHDEPDILIRMIRKGISSFVLKPIVLEDVFAVLYPVCRDANTQKVNFELFTQLNEEKTKLELQVRLLKAQLHAIAVKNRQLEELAPVTETTVSVENKALLNNYFAKDEDQGDESVVFHQDDVDEIKEILVDIPDFLIRYCDDKEKRRIEQIAEHFTKLANIFLLYTPFMDPLAKALENLAHAIVDGEGFVRLINEKQEATIRLFDAVCVDLGLYAERFATESMAMRNIHHIHQPTTLSIEQIIGMIYPETVDEGDIELF
ncbi:MAG: response regulator transcription factor [Sulfuricurvum sp.]